MAVMNDKNKPNENRYQRSGEEAASSPTDSYEAAHANKKQQEKDATKKGAKTAAKAAGTYLGGAAGGKAVDAISKTKVGDKVLNKGAEALNRVPGMGKAMKKLDDKKVLDAADKAVDIAGANPQSGASNGALGEKASGMPGGTDSNSSSGGESSVAGASGSALPSKPKFLDNGEDEGNDNKEKPGNFLGQASGNILVKIAIMAILPFFGIVIFFFMIIASVSGGGIASYEDAFGVSAATGGETGDIDYNSSNPDARAFYDRVNSVKQSYQAMGKSINALYISGVYSQLRTHAGFSYKDMTTQVIQTIADAMFNGNTFSKEIFHQNLVSSVFPTYVPGKSVNQYKNMADAVFDYVDEYLSLIGQDTSSCAAVGSCIYEVKGFFIAGNGNVEVPMSINNLQVRLMECGGAYGNGTYGVAIDQPLVPFENYVAGVAYAEVGPDANLEVLKAQMVVARSYALARPTAMGNALGKKLEQEDGKWILQISSCVADQVFCNIDEGCSYMGGGDGQGGIVRSGIIPGAIRTRPPLPEDHPIRVAAAAVQGELLINAEGYIISSGFLSTEQNKFSNLASQGLNYKQILMQVYNEGSRSYGASDIQKSNCNTGSGGSCSSSGTTGPYASWKQGDPAWGSIPLGTSSYNISGAGCLVTSVAMLIAKSGVATTVEGDFNPGSFVKKLNATGGFSGADFVWGAVSNAAPNFQFVGKQQIAGQTRAQKLQAIKMLVDMGYYVVVEVKGETGQHWVAVDSVDALGVKMMDPASDATDMWSEYEWYNSSWLGYFRVTS